jgi:hypothetical protein
LVTLDDGLDRFECSRTRLDQRVGQTAQHHGEQLVHRAVQGPARGQRPRRMDGMRTPGRPGRPHSWVSSACEANISNGRGYTPCGGGSGARAHCGGVSPAVASIEVRQTVGGHMGRYLVGVLHHLVCQLGDMEAVRMLMRAPQWGQHGGVRMWPDGATHQGGGGGARLVKQVDRDRIGRVE